MQVFSFVGRVKLFENAEDRFDEGCVFNPLHVVGIPIRRAQVRFFSVVNYHRKPTYLHQVEHRLFLKVLRSQWHRTTY